MVSFMPWTSYVGVDLDLQSSLAGRGSLGVCVGRLLQQTYPSLSSIGKRLPKEAKKIRSETRRNNMDLG
jgi:hypothetical protein